MAAKFERATIPGGGAMNRPMPAPAQTEAPTSDADPARPPDHRPGAHKVQAQARRLWELFRQAPGFICILRGPDHVFAFANESYTRLVGGRELLGKPLLEALPEVADQGFPDILGQVFRAGKPYTSFETPIRLRQLDGQLEQRFLNFVYQPIRDVHGQTTGVFVEGFDVTERVLAQAALWEGEAQLKRQRRFYEAILTTTPDHAYIFDLDHRFVFANEGLLKTWGKTREEAIGKTCLELGYPDWLAARLDREIEQIIATKQPVRGMVPFTGAFGKKRLYDYIYTPVLNAEGEVEAVAGTSRDVTELRQAGKATARLASIVDSTDDAIISEDLRGDILTWNHSAERMFGYGADEAIGRPATALIVPADRQEESAEVLRRLARGETIEHLETIRRRKDGTTLEISVTISSVYENGRLVGSSKIIRDIGARKRIERHRKLLIQELNHRVKNTLATVQALARQSLRDADSTEEGYAAFDARLLALSKAHDVLTHEHWAFAGLKKIVAGAIEPYSSPDGESRFYVKGVSMRLQPHAGLALAMALHELATNAVKHGALSGENGHVAIHWQHTRERRKGKAIFRLRWAESGGPPVSLPRRHGFGSRLIKQGLAQDLGGAVKLHFERSGLVCEISAPLDGIVADLQEPPSL